MVESYFPWERVFDDGPRIEEEDWSMYGDGPHVEEDWGAIFLFRDQLRKTRSFLQRVALGELGSEVGGRGIRFLFPALHPG
jgi:hypothetical protein